MNLTAFSHFYHSIMFNFTAVFFLPCVGVNWRGMSLSPPSEASNMKHMDAMKDVWKYFTERHSGCFPSLGMRGGLCRGVEEPAERNLILHY